MNYVATCLFGMEKFICDDIAALGYKKTDSIDGRVFFEGDESILARTNIGSRFAERILIVMGMFKALTFDELFENVKALDWADIIGKDDKFPVSGRSLSSRLASIPDCQKIIKKAIVEKLNLRYHQNYFEETGIIYQVRFLILKDNVTVMIDTSGTGLHKRGYRALSNDAPIKETLAAALVELSRVRSNHTVYDPFCGSGTILIEAAMKAMNIAPGLRREFVSESWHIAPDVWRNERNLAESAIISNCDFYAYGSDIDKSALDIALANAEKAGVSKRINFERADIKDFQTHGDFATVICNPPYGERLLNQNEALKIYSVMGERFKKMPHHSYTVITPEDDFEKSFGRSADKRRKLYNGMIPCQVYMYYK